MDAMTIEPCRALIYAIDAKLGRDGQAIGINRGLRQLGLFRYRVVSPWESANELKF